MPVERKGRFAVANPDALNRWLASQAHSPEPFHIVHTGERDLVDELKRSLAATRKRVPARGVVKPLCRADWVIGLLRT
jgi:hypothetical protein